MSIAENIALNFFPLCMVYAAFSDLLTMRISNGLSLLLCLMFFVLTVMIGISLETVGWHALCACSLLIVGFVLFSLHWIGGGDAKLAAATALWLGWPATLQYLVITSLIGGIITLLLLFMRKFPLPHFFTKYKWIVHLHKPTTGVPYGIALSCAGLLMFPSSPLWLMVVK
jgi:prepilin peptidase CpaA